MHRSAAKWAVAAAVIAVAAIAMLLLAGRDTAPGSAQASAPSSSPAVPSESATSAVAADAVLVRPDSHVLGDPADGRVVLVEFLDFECESCAAWYPVVEDLRKRYEGRVRFVNRYFPLPSHANSVNAALAVEAAARLGKYEEMALIMFGTQSTWGEKHESQAPLFRQFATELGLDLAEYDRAVADPQTLARVQADVTDGQALGVAGTPTFFLNGEQIQPEGGDDFAALLDAALADPSP